MKNLSNQTFNYGIDIDGLWVGNYENDLQFVLYVEETESSLGINVMGKLVVPMDYQKQGDQVLIKFKNTKGDIYHLLAQVNEKNEMRMSITSEVVHDFMPIGQLVEKVYRLHKVQKTEEIVARLSLATQNVVINYSEKVSVNDNA